MGLLKPDGILIEANQTALTAIGATREEVIGQFFWATPWWTHSPDLQIQLQQAILQAAAGQFIRFEAKHFLADGTFITVDFSLNPILDESGKVVLLIPEGRDISDHKAAEQKILEQAMLLNVATDAILVRDLENRIRFWNQGAEQIYGWSTAEAIDREVNSLLYRDLLPEATTAFNTVLQQGEWQGELHKVTKSGKAVVVQSRWTLIRNEATQPQKILSVDTDITEKKQLEAQFLRTQRLESLGTLASGIAHDMNNVLTPILAASQLLPLRLPNLDDRSQSLLRMLEESARRGSQLVQQILSFARGSDGTRSSIQVEYLLREVVRVARQTFPKSVDISINLATGNLWMVSADATQLHQVLMNLLINARDAMPDGGTLTIAAENVVLDENYARMSLDARAGSYVAVTIADTGTGIPPELLDRIFEPFFTTKEPGKGTGLGLSTTLGIIKSHGGFINVYSEVGQGTRFKIYLPAEKDSNLMSPIATLESPIGNGELVLVVDDEASVREITKASLENYNYRVMLASDGIEAIALYAQHQDKIQFILLDLMMPSLDSASTIRALQKINSNVAIVVMSGLSANEPIKNMSDVTVQGFIAKPFTSQALLQTLHQLRVKCLD
jgi:PAS domain S-box-containing protein